MGVPSERDFMELLRLVEQRELQREQLAFEREKWEAEHQKTRRGLWDGAPLNTTVLVAVIGGLVTVFTGYYQIQANRELERTKYESQMILRALEPADSAERVRRLAFLVHAGLLDDPGGKIQRLAQSADLPRFQPTAPTLAAPIVENARVFLLAGTAAKLGMRPGLQDSLAKAGFAVLGAKPLVDPERPRGPEVRYFNESDRAQADSIAAFLHRRDPLQADRGALYPDPTAKAGYIEIWLGQ